MENHAAGSAANRPLDGIDVPAYLTAILFGLAHILCVSLEIDNSPLPPPQRRLGQSRLRLDSLPGPS